jgi:outer membrane lipase/esterase
VLAQVAGMWAPAHAIADPNALYVVVGGGNDMRDARSAFTGNTAADNAGREAAAQAAVDNLFLSLSILASHGAHHVLLSNLPNLGQTPEAALLGLQFASSDVSSRFSTLMLGLKVMAESILGLDVDLLDMAGIANDVRNDALNNGGAVYGITNATAPCTGFAFSAAMGGTSCDVSAFSDALHPSARLHAIIGAEALALVVPEPASAWLVLVALSGLALRRKQVAAA